MNSPKKTITFIPSNLAEAQKELENLDPNVKSLKLKIEAENEGDLADATVFVLNVINEIPENKVEELYIGCPGFDFDGRDYGIFYKKIPENNPSKNLFQNAFPHLKQIELETILNPEYGLYHENLRVFKQRSGSVILSLLNMPNLQYFNLMSYCDVHGVPAEYYSDFFFNQNLKQLSILDISDISYLDFEDLLKVLFKKSQFKNLNLIVNDGFLDDIDVLMSYVDDLKKLKTLMINYEDEDFENSESCQSLKKELGNKLQFIDHLEVEWKGDDLQAKVMKHVGEDLVVD